MLVTLKDVYDRIDELAPFSLQEEWDNAGILAGSAGQRVTSVLLALDLTPAVVQEALDGRVQLIVTHHPILFHGRKNLREDDPEGRMLCTLVRGGVGLIAAHTNFDNAAPGVNDALAARLGLQNVEQHAHGLRVGVPMQETLGEFCSHTEQMLGGVVRCYGDREKRISRVAVLGGAGEDFTGEAIEAGADVYVTGEVAYHKALDAQAAGLNLLEAGHAATELPALKMLAEGLQIGPNGVKWKLRIFLSEAALYR